MFDLDLSYVLLNTTCKIVASYDKFIGEHGKGKAWLGLSERQFRAYQRFAESQRFKTWPTQFFYQYHLPCSVLLLPCSVLPCCSSMFYYVYVVLHTDHYS